MRPRALVVGAACLVALVALSYARTAKTLSGPGLIRISAIRVSDNGEFPNYVSFWLNDRRGDRIGWGVRMCHHAGSGGPLGRDTEICEGTYVLPRGKIQTQGTRRSNSSWLAAVTGGTGLYSNVGGSLLVERVDAKVDRLLFSLEAF